MEKDIIEKLDIQMRGSNKFLYENVQNTKIQPLIEEFRKLPLEDRKKTTLLEYILGSVELYKTSKKDVVYIKESINGKKCETCINAYKTMGNECKCHIVEGKINETGFCKFYKV